MSGRFVRPAMVIDVRTKYFPFEYGFLEGPGYYDIPPLRVIFHELTHFWQTVSMNFLSNVAFTEWRTLLKYEAKQLGGEISDLSKELHTADHTAGFSANDLLETLSRYWDIHTLGPQKILEWQGLNTDYDLAKRFDLIRSPTETISPYAAKEFDAAMLAATYAEPYRLIHEKLKSFHAAVAFPILAYFAFQSPHPVRLYHAAVASAGNLLSSLNTRSIHDAWREVFAKLAKHAFQVGAQVESPIAIPHSVLPTLAMRSGGSTDNTILNHYGKILSILDDVSGPHQLDFYFALPGDPESRGLLIGQLLPPVVRFVDGKWTMQSLLQQKLESNVTKGTMHHEQLANAAEDIDRRYREFQLAALLSRKSAS